MANNAKPEVTKEEIKIAQSLWTSFTVWTKWGVIAAVIGLSLMAITLV